MALAGRDLEFFPDASGVSAVFDAARRAVIAGREYPLVFHQDSPDASAKTC